MTPYLFEAIDLYAFDLHVATGALMQRDRDALRPEFRFLIDPAKYAAQHAKRAAVVTPSFTIAPLSFRILARNHFWRHYKGIWTRKGRPDAWKLQLPIVCTPLDDELRVNDPTLHRSMRGRVYLWGWGWSSYLRIRLAGHISSETLSGFVGSLKNKEATPFTIGGEPGSLVSVFRRYSDRVRREVYADDATPGDVLKVSHHFVISIARFTGAAPVRYDGMAEADRAMLYGILYGKSMSLPEWAADERSKKLLLTPYPGPNFALTSFEEGTLVFLQDVAGAHDAAATSDCHASNLATTAMMIRALLSLYQEAARGSQSNRAVASLRRWVRTDLEALPEKYLNPFCMSYYLHYGPLLKALRHDDAEA